MNKKIILEVYIPDHSTSEPNIFELDEELLENGFNLPFRLPDDQYGYISITLR